MNRLSTHKGMILGLDGQWKAPQRPRRVSDACPTHPSGQHVYTSTKRIGDGPKVTVCSWCERRR